MGTVEIPLERYEELITLEARVNVAVGYIANNTYPKMEDILLTLGTELACETAMELRAEEKRRLEELNKKYAEMKESEE